jgi:hypothetical protein
MSNYIHPDDIIGRMHSVTEEAVALIDHVETYFESNGATEEDLLRIRLEYNKIGSMLRGALELLRLAENENIRWNQRPAEQIMQEAETINNSRE